jgi:hypothetical protein
MPAEYPVAENIGYRQQDGDQQRQAAEEVNYFADR